MGHQEHGTAKWTLTSEILGLKEVRVSLISLYVKIRRKEKRVY
jgi:hypothetical protein